MMEIFTRPLLSALGVFGAAYTLFSYFGDGALPFAVGATLLTLALSLGLQQLPKERAAWTLYALLVLLLALPLILRESFLASALSAAVPLLEILKEPYDLDMTAPAISTTASAFLVKAYLALFLSYFFTAGCFSLFARWLSGLLGLLTLFIGFYFGVNPPAFAAILTAAYLLTLPASLSRGIGAPEVPVFALAALLGFLSLAVLPEGRYSQPAFFSAAQEKILSFTDPYDPIFHAGNGYTGMMKGAAGHQTLGSTNGVRYTGRIIADISSPDVTGPLYIRSWVGGAYEGNQWKDLPDDAYANYQGLFAKNQGEWYDQGAWLMEVAARNPAISQKLMNHTDKDAISSYKQEFTIAAVYEDTHFFLLPYDADFGGNFFRYDRSPIAPAGKAYTTDLWQLPAGALLALMSREAIDDPYYRTYLDGESRYRAFVYSHYLTVPEDVKAAIAAVHPMSEAKTLADKRQRIEDIYQFLESNYQYAKNPGKTPKGADFISHFLMESKKGYCTSFASAAVMLLRASGIPARYAVGLSVDSEEINGAPLVNGEHRLAVNDHHAHAWAEVYVDGLGWRPVEMTPGDGGGENPFPTLPDKEKNNTGAPNAPAASDSQKSQSREPSPRQNQQPQKPSPAPSQGNKNPPLAPAAPQQPQAQPRNFLPLLAIAFVLLLAAALLYRRLSFIPRLLSRKAGNEKDFARLLAYAARLSKWAGHGAQGSYEARRKSYAKDPRFAGFDEILSLLVKSKFSGAPLTENEKEEIRTIIANTRAQCLASLPLLAQIKFRLIERL